MNEQCSGASPPPSVSSGAETPPRSDRKARVRTLLRLVVGLALIGVIIWRTNLEQFLATFAHVDPFWLVTGFVVQTSSVYVWALRWSRILTIFAMPLPLARLFKGVFVGAFLSSFLPTSLGGDFYRSYWVLDDKRLFRKSVFVVFVERFIGLITLAYLILPVFVVLIVEGFDFRGAFLPGIVVIGVLCASVLAMHPSVFDACDRAIFGERKLLKNVRVKLSGALRALHDGGKQLFAAYLYSLIIQVQGIVYFYCLGRALGLPLELWHYLLIVPPTVLATTFLPISFNGLGVREGMLILMTSMLDVTVRPAEAVALGVLVLAMSFVVTLIGAVFYLVGDARVPVAASARSAPDLPG